MFQFCRAVNGDLDMIVEGGRCRSDLADEQLAELCGLSTLQFEHCCRGLPQGLLRLTEADRLLLVSPLAFWRSAALLRVAQRSGAQVWVLDEFCPQTAGELIRDLHITVSDWLPWQMVRFLAAPGSWKIPNGHRAAWVGGARLPLARQRGAAEFWGEQLFQHFSQARWPGCFVAFANDLLERPGTAGRWNAAGQRLAGQSEVQLVGREGEPRGLHQVGRLVIGGELVADSVGKLAEEQLGFFDNDWFYPLGKVSNAVATECGWLTAYEGEQLLERHPAVAEAVLIACTSERMQGGAHTLELPEGFYAVVELASAAQPASPLLELELLDFCARALSADKAPISLLFTEKMPRALSGQPDLAALASLIVTDISAAHTLV